jgi:hypothetical protein
MAQQPLENILDSDSSMNHDAEQFDELPPVVLCQVAEEGLPAEEQVVNQVGVENPKKRGRTVDSAWTYLCEDLDQH